MTIVLSTEYNFLRNLNYLFPCIQYPFWVLVSCRERGGGRGRQGEKGTEGGREVGREIGRERQRRERGGGRER